MRSYPPGPPATWAVNVRLDAPPVSGWTSSIRLPGAHSCAAAVARAARSSRSTSPGIEILRMSAGQRAAPNLARSRRRRKQYGSMTDGDRTNELLDLLALEELDTNLYRAGNPDRPLTAHLFGGQVAAQALRAASHTVDEDRMPHSLHGYFLRGGRPDRPTILTVDRDRDGRSFSARHVNAIQDGDVIFSMLASFHVDEDGVDYQLEGMPDGVVVPESLDDSDRPRPDGMFNIRSPEPREADAWGSRRMWAHPLAEIPEDR